MVNLDRNCCIHVNHDCSSIQDATIGKELLCEYELINKQDRYAVTVTKDRVVTGHFPQKILCIYLILVSLKRRKHC